MHSICRQLCFCLILLIFIVFNFCGFGQSGRRNFADFNPLQLNGIQIRCIGPTGMGRINSISVYEKNPDIIYLGIASSGVWKTINGGITWSPLFDEQPTLNIGAVAVQQNTPLVVWAGTGDGAIRNTLAQGEGIFKSVDGGKSWKCMGLENTVSINKILIDPKDPNIVYVAVNGNAFSEHIERGVYKTVDGGRNWTRILYTNSRSGCGELIMNPKNPRELYANMWEHERKPWMIISGGVGSGLYHTIDGGTSWKKLGVDNGLPGGIYGRIGLAFSTSNTKVRYALIEAAKPGLYRSCDGGKKWNLMFADTLSNKVLSQRPFYFQKIYCDPQNENKVWVLNVDLLVSNDGGKTFKPYTDFKPFTENLHPDFHAFWISPSDSNFVMCGNDGAFALSKDAGKNWQESEDIPMAQVYSVSVDDDVPYNVMGGLQDNGVCFGPSSLAGSPNFLTNDFWYNMKIGDGFTAFVDRTNRKIIYGVAQRGRLNKVNLNNPITNPFSNYNFSPPDFPYGPSSKNRFNWNTPFANDPFDRNGIYFGSQYLFKSTNSGHLWEQISGDLTTNDSAKYLIGLLSLDTPKFRGNNLQVNGGLTRDRSGAELFCTITTIEPSSLQRNEIWIGTDDGKIHYTIDGGQSYVDVTSNLNDLPKGCYIERIKSSMHNVGEVFVVASNYRRGDRTMYVFRSKDYGKTWKRIMTEGMRNSHALSIMQDIKEPRLIFLGTSKGLYVSYNNGENFQKWSADLPSVAVTDIMIKEPESDLVISTFGRSFWILEDLTPLRYLAKNSSYPEDTLYLFNTLPQYTFSPGLKVNSNSRSKSELHTKNRAQGVPITFYCNPDFFKGLSDTAFLTVFDSHHKTLSNEPEKILVKPGINRFFYTPQRYNPSAYLYLEQGLYNYTVSFGETKRHSSFVIHNRN